MEQPKESHNGGEVQGGYFAQSTTNGSIMKPALANPTRVKIKQAANGSQPLTDSITSNGLHVPKAGSSRDNTLSLETGVPAGRRSVQFARPTILGQVDGVNMGSDSMNSAGGESPIVQRRGPSLLSKLRALTTSSAHHARSPSTNTVGGESIDDRLDVFTPDNDTPLPGFSDSPRGYGSETDADGEQSGADEGNVYETPRKKRRKSRRPQDGGTQTAPATPKTPFMREGRPNFFSFNSQGSGERHLRPTLFPRRSTLTDLPNEDRLGVSEDEGRERLAGLRRLGHGTRGASIGGPSKQSQQQSSNDPPRPSTFKRALTSFGGSSEAADGLPFSPWRRGGERTASLSAAKWRQIKAGLKLMGRQRKPETTIDHAKSAELLAELTAGVPAALILASMFQRDEHGHRRIPILLEQLKVRLADSKNVDSRSGDRHLIFKIDLEYGNGLTRMKWTVHRTLRDFTNLHGRYKLHASTQKYIQLKGEEARTKLPHFPKSAFPYLRGIRGDDMSGSEPEDEIERDVTAPSGNEASGPERPSGKKRQSSTALMRRKSSLANVAFGGSSAADEAGGITSTARRDHFPERQRRMLETYLQQLIRYLIFRPESNRLCKFLELSALGIRLSAEGSYHGKEGYLYIQSGKGPDFRKAWTPSLIKSRHSPKWFLVRHSYIVCVESPEEMNIYDVFLLDSDFRIKPKQSRLPMREQNAKSIAKSAKESARHPQHHLLKIYNSERKMRLFAKNERQQQQFEESINYMIANSCWSGTNRFDSFAPIRQNVFAQWLVDGRDYMWNVSRAISMARDVIYIHDWWLSPELYLRRPGAISKKWRLDRLLQKKAREGVKVFVIMYRNINSAIPIDSEYSKFSLLDLHHNVFVQRSPNQIRQGTFFWAHHEKLVIVDHMIAFLGGIDLCFGRWDTPQHTVADDKLTGFENSEMPKDADHCQLWPGKDYSNPRVQDFYALDKPYEEMYERSETPRMPWHDIGMQVVGQPARDLTRHFIQRWNFILRQRKPTRPTPFLLPPPEFNPADLEALGLEGTCEVQMLRSCGTWSMGTPGRVEHSIMNAYSKMIEQSDHFVYIENQFFITSCEVNGTVIENTIGDALVERIIRAHKHDEDWRAVILIPLMPGFQNTVDSPDGSSVRLIMQCQFMSISRGERSIFGRLRNENIEPEDYIQFYSLRSWGNIGPNQTLVTEQLYIHAKCMIVDDRMAIIGSANINERSMLGLRDSETAAVVRDTDMIWSTMNGEPYLVGKFPHTLRMRLMREHLGIDVDEAMEEERAQADERWEEDMNEFHGEEGNLPHAHPEPDVKVDTDKAKQQKLQEEFIARNEFLHSFNHNASVAQKNNPNLQTNRKKTQDSRVTGNEQHKKDVDGEGFDRMKESPTGFSSARDRNATVTSLSSHPPKSDVSQASENQGNVELPPPNLPRMSTAELGLPMLSQLPELPTVDDTDIGGPSLHRIFSTRGIVHSDPHLTNMKRPFVDKDCMRDPLNDDFYHDVWLTVAENNTNLFRAVFRCQPDNEVRTWNEYKEYIDYSDRFSQSQGNSKSKDRVQRDTPGISGPPGIAGTGTMSEKLEMLGPAGRAAGEVTDKLSKATKKSHINIPEMAKIRHSPVGRIEGWGAEADLESNPPRSVDENRGVHEDEVLDEKSNPKEQLNLPNSSNINRQPSQKSARTQSGRAHSRSVGQSDKPSPDFRTSNSTKRKRRNTHRTFRKEFHASDHMLNPDDARELLKMVQGHLVIFPTEW